MEANSKVKLEAQIRECYARVVWTHKIHEKCADILNGRDHCFKLILIILSVLTTTGIIIIVLGDNQCVEIISAILSAILSFFNVYLKKYNLGKIAQKHTETAAILWDIRETYLSVITDLKANIIDVDDVVCKRDILQKKLAALYKGCPRTSFEAYKKAAKALKCNEEMTFSDEEIDLLLNPELRKNRN